MSKPDSMPVKDEAQQLSLAQKVMALGLSVRQTEALCKKLTKQAQPVKEQPPQVDYLAECEKELTAGLGRKVRIVSGKRKGRIELEYYGQDDLQQLYDALHTADAAGVDAIWLERPPSDEDWRDVHDRLSRAAQSGG